MGGFLLLISYFLAVLAAVIRKSMIHVWRGIDDPFGRRCKNMGSIDHPEYAALKAENPSSVFLQLDVVIRDIDVDTTLSTLLRGSEQNADEQHLAYYELEGSVFSRSFKKTVESIIQPWEEKGYSVVVGAMSRSYV